jgi:two-component system, LytTR family, sensor kinase
MTLTRGKRPLLIALGWLAFYWLQAGLLAAGDYRLDRVPGLFVVYGIFGLAWGGLTLAVGVWVLPSSMDSWRVTALRHFLGVLICGLADTLVRRIVQVVLGGAVLLPWYGTMLYFADRTAVSYLAIVVLSRALAAQDRFVARQQVALSLQAELARARLASLEAQLHPHFLFNCLGAVTELAHEAPAAAARMLRQLASVLRFAVDRQGTEVTLSEELLALDDYLDVQRARFSDWLTIETRVDPEARDLLMPPLVLQPLVENAIRHGLSRRDAPGAIVLTGAISGDELVLEVRDNGVGLRGGHLSGRGIGTMNLRDRLSTLYGDGGRLMLFEDAAGGVISHVSIPAHRSLPAPEITDLAPEGGGWMAIAFRRWPVVSVLVAWAIWGLLYTQQSIAYLAFRNRLAGRSVVDIASRDFTTSMIWAALTPLMLLMARLVPLVRRQMALRIGAHVMAAVAIGAIHFWITGLLYSTGGAPDVGEMIAEISWGVIAYAIILAIAHNGRIQAWLQERDLADSRMRVDIAEAELEAALSRTGPRQLLDRLEAIAQSIQQDAAAAERMLARLGDELRAALESRVPA